MKGEANGRQKKAGQEVSLSGEKVNCECYELQKRLALTTLHNRDGFTGNYDGCRARLR